MADIQSAVRRDLVEIGERLASADRRQLAAAVMGDDGARQAAEDERLAALGERWAASIDLADLFLLLLRHALEHRREALELYLGDITRQILAEELPDAMRAVFESCKVTK